MTKLPELSRRRLLRGTFMGAAVVVGTPMLEMMLNTNGTALAQGGALPTRFVGWTWGLGLTPGTWEPAETGPLAGQKLGHELVAFEDLKDKINIFSKMKANLDGRPNFPHSSGWVAQLTGSSPQVESMSLPTVDTLIADEIGRSQRFPQLNVTASGNARDVLSYRRGGVHQPGEASPSELYSRLFLGGFQDPNSGEFTPDPALLAEKSVLSSIKDQRDTLMRDLGAADRRRMDEYFTSVRQLERQIEVLTEEPAPMAACSIPDAPEEFEVGNEIEQTLKTHEVMSNLVAHALACDQTRVAQMAFSSPGSGLRLVGDSVTHHMYSHQEAPDPELGYQKMTSYFNKRSMDGLATLIRTLDNFKEGDASLLDRTIVMATSDCGNANTHATDNVPVITAGTANGAIKTGLHIESVGDTAARIPLTVMQALRMPVSRFGTEGNEATNPVTEVLA